MEWSTKHNVRERALISLHNICPLLKRGIKGRSNPKESFLGLVAAFCFDAGIDYYQDFPRSQEDRNGDHRRMYTNGNRRRNRHYLNLPNRWE